MGVLATFRLDGRKALITGGSRGLGRAVAQAFAEVGADLVLVGRDLDALRRAADELRPSGRSVCTIVADVGDGTVAEAMCGRALEEHGPIDILVNNVGGRRENIATETLPL